MNTTLAANTDATTDAFKPQEVAYRLPGGEWKRRVIRAEAAFDRLIEKLIGDGAEILTRDAG